MALTVSTNFDNIEIIIPPATGVKPVTLTVPPLDCMRPVDTAAINAQIKEKGDMQGGEILQLMLKFFNSTKAAKAAIENLVPRQLNEIDEYWQQQSELKPGESSPSTDS